MRRCADQVVSDLSLMIVLEQFEPVVIGTPPLGISIDTSDIDVACSSHDLMLFRAVARDAFGGFERFQCREIVAQETPAQIVQFHAFEWDVELFCQSIPTNQQWGVRHFDMERRILELAPELRTLVRTFKSQGMKTEPAFAAVLGLQGDPYEAILELEALTDNQLHRLIMKARRGDDMSQ